MSDFMNRGVAADTGPAPPAEGNIFAGSQWGGPDQWDGPVWSEKYKKYITKKDQEFDEAAEAVAKRNAQHHDDDLHKAECPCSVPSHHSSYLQDIKRRIEPLVETINNLEHQIGQLSTHITSSHPSTSTSAAPDAAAGEGAALKETEKKVEPPTVEQHNKALEKTVTQLKGQVHDVGQKLHAIVKNAEGGVKRLGGIDQGSKEEVGHIYRTEVPK